MLAHHGSLSTSVPKKSHAHVANSYFIGIHEDTGAEEAVLGNQQSKVLRKTCLLSWPRDSGERKRYAR